MKNGKPTTTQRHIRDVLEPLHELYCSSPALRFGPLALKTLRQQLVEHGLCRTTINKNVGIIKRTFKWAAENELLPVAVHHALQTVSGLRRGRPSARGAEPVKPVPEAHVEAVLPHVSRQLAAMIQLQTLTAMRPGEVTIMRACDLDSSGRVWSYILESHKTEHHGKKRVIYLGPQAQAIIRPFLRKDLSAYLFSPAGAVEERNRQRRANRRTPMTPSQQSRKRKANPRHAPRDRNGKDSYRKAIQRACGRAWRWPSGQSACDLGGP